MRPSQKREIASKRHRLLKSWLTFLLLTLWSASPIILNARAGTASETEVKAAFLYNFAKFVEWPPTAFASEEAPIKVVVVGDEEFATKLASLLKDKKALGRSFEVKKFSSAQELKTAQIVFVPNSETKRFPQTLEVIKNLPVLTVGESAQFLNLGGMINFVVQDAQLRFEIYPEAAEKARLVISSKLMRLAKSIKKGEGK